MDQISPASSVAAGAQAPLRILHAEFSDNWGGQELRVLEQLAWLTRAGHTAALACRPNFAVAARAADFGVVCHPLVFRGVYNPISMLRACAVVRREGYEVVDCHGLREAIAFAAARDRCIVVRSQHVTGKIKKGPRHRWVWSRACDHVIATAGRIKDELIAAGCAGDAHVSVVGEWAAADFFRLDDKPRHRREVRAEFGLAPEQTLIVNVGMLRHDKGQEFVIDALAHLREAGSDAVALLIGSSTAQAAIEPDNYESVLRRRVAEHGMSDRVIFTGYRQDVARLVQAADVQVVASVAVEGQSRTVPQAFAAAVPVVATTAGGLTELVADRVTGLLVPPRDSGAIAVAITGLLRDAAARAAMTDAARTFALSHLTIDAKMAETVALYRRLVAARHPNRFSH